MTVITPDFAQRLRQALQRRAAATITDAQAQRAAVAVIVTAEAEPAMLFVRRQERIGDPWSGHVAFPGGYAEPTDGSAAATAVRETEEETGLVLSPSEALGTLDDVYPRSVHLPKVVVTPVAFCVSMRRPVAPRAEIAATTWLPLAEVFSAGNRRPLELVLPSGRQAFESIVVGEFIIWGLTERILSQIARLVVPPEA